MKKISKKLLSGLMLGTMLLSGSLQAGTVTNVPVSGAATGIELGEKTFLETNNIKITPWSQFNKATLNYDNSYQTRDENAKMQVTQSAPDKDGNVVTTFIYTQYVTTTSMLKNNPTILDGNTGLDLYIDVFKEGEHKGKYFYGHAKTDTVSLMSGSMTYTYNVIKRTEPTYVVSKYFIRHPQEYKGLVFMLGGANPTQRQILHDIPEYRYNYNDYPALLKNSYFFTYENK